MNLCLKLLLVIFVFYGTVSAAKDKKKSEEIDETSGAVIMDVIQVQGKIDRPQAVYIINLSNPGFRNVALEKNFNKEIKNEKFDEIGHFSVDDILEIEEDMLNQLPNQ